MATVFGIVGVILTAILVLLLVYLFAISMSYIKMNLIYKINLVLKAAARREESPEVHEKAAVERQETEHKSEAEPVPDRDEI